MIKRFVTAGLGVSFVVPALHATKVLAGRVKVIPPKEKEMWRELGFVYRRD